MIHDGIELSRDEGHKQSIIVYGFQCKNNACEETYIYISETKQPMHKRMYQHRSTSASGINDSSIYSHLNGTQHSFEDKDIVILDKEQKWFERGVKEAIYVCWEIPSLNKGGALRHNLLKAYDAAIKKIPKRLSSCNNSTLSRITEQEEDHPISDEMQYCSH